jgi:hypothetical protein
MADEKQKPAPPREEWREDMIRAVPDSLLRDIVNDIRRGPAVRSSLASRPQSSEPARPVGGGTVPIQPPPGIDIIDRMCASQAAIERTAAIKQRIESEWIEHLISKKIDSLGHDDDE